MRAKERERKRGNKLEMNSKDFSFLCVNRNRKLLESLGALVRKSLRFYCPMPISNRSNSHCARRALSISLCAYVCVPVCVCVCVCLTQFRIAFGNLHGRDSRGDSNELAAASLCPKSLIHEIITRISRTLTQQSNTQQI